MKIKIGQQVRINGGKYKNLSGQVSSFMPNNRVVMVTNLLSRALYLEVPEALLSPHTESIQIQNS